MEKQYHAIYEILRDFAVRHITSMGEYESTAEIDIVLQRIDQVRGVGQEPDEGRDQLAPGEAELVPRNLQGWLLENIGQFFMSTALVKHARAAKYALKKSAYADVVRAIIECERYLDERPDDTDRGDQVLPYLDTMRDLEAGLAADLDPSRAVLEDKNNGA